MVFLCAFFFKDGERRQIFRDEVDHLKKVKRPAETNHGYFQPQEDGNQPLYQDSYRPDTHDNYRPTYQVSDHRDHDGQTAVTSDPIDTGLNERLIRIIINHLTKTLITLRIMVTNLPTSKTIHHLTKMTTNQTTRMKRDRLTKTSTNRIIKTITSHLIKMITSRRTKTRRSTRTTTNQSNKTITSRHLMTQKSHFLNRSILTSIFMALEIRNPMATTDTISIKNRNLTSPNRRHRLNTMTMSR